MATSAAPPASCAGHGEAVASGRVLFFLGRHLEERAIERAQVDIRGGRRLRPVERGTGDRCVPAAAGCRQESVGLFGQARVQLRERELALVLGIVQRERHGGDDERRVLVAPGRRCRTCQKVRERPHRKRGETGVDAVAIRDEHVAILRRQCRDRCRRTRTHAVRTRDAIGRQRDVAEELCELTCRATAQQIHLEEALLRVHVAERPGQIATVRGAHRDGAKRIAFDGDRCRKRGRNHLPVVARQAAADEQPAGRPRGAGHDQEDDDDAREDAEHDGRSGRRVAILPDRRRARQPPRAVSASRCGNSCNSILQRVPSGCDLHFV